MPSWLDDAGDAVRRTIRAYHGSPYDFDKFDAAKIGTGEGAQAYGRGLYFAGNESVAEQYRKSLAGTYATALASDEDLPKYFAPGNVVDGYGGPDKVLQFNPGPEGEPWRWSVQVVRAGPDGVPLPYERPRVHSTHPYASAVDKFLGRPPRRPGHTYEVEIDHPESSLLDWDASISKQPEAVDELIRSRLSGGYFGMIGEAGDGRRMWHHMYDSYGPQKAAGRLLDAGIPGIRYLDQGSRSAGQGTRNYVMFPGTEDSIRILRKYGMLAPVAAGAASQYNDAP
jgi:hypothetical protein